MGKLLKIKQGHTLKNVKDHSGCWMKKAIGESKRFKETSEKAPAVVGVRDGNLN